MAQPFSLHSIYEIFMRKKNSLMWPTILLKVLTTPTTYHNPTTYLIFLLYIRKHQHAILKFVVSRSFISTGTKHWTIYLFSLVSIHHIASRILMIRNRSNVMFYLNVCSELSTFHFHLTFSQILFKMCIPIIWLEYTECYTNRKLRNLQMLVMATVLE